MPLRSALKFQQEYQVRGPVSRADPPDRVGVAPSQPLVDQFRPDFVHAVRERANAPTRQGVNRSQLCRSHITLCKVRFTISPQSPQLLPAPPSQDARRTPPPSSSPTAPRRTPCPPPWPPWHPPPNRRRRRTRRPGSPAIRPPAAVRRALVWAAVEVEEGGAGGRDGVVNPCPHPRVGEDPLERGVVHR